MTQINIRKAIGINAPASKVYGVVSDFNQWRPWSPWLIMEPQATSKVAEDAKYYEWQGQQVGSGNMQVTAERVNASVDYDLTFFQPRKSTAKVRFEITEKDGITEAAWLMEFSMPFFLFFMKNMMTAFLGMDYSRGLAMLKDYVETGDVPSKLDFTGDSTYAGCQYVGITTHCAMDDLGKNIAADMEKINTHFKTDAESVVGNFICIYHKWQPVKGQVSYTAALPVKGDVEGLPAGFVTGSIPSTKVHSVRHTGPYTHIANAWSTMNNLRQNKVFKPNNKIHPFETYINLPGQVADNELTTDVSFAIR